MFFFENKNIFRPIGFNRSPAHSGQVAPLSSSTMARRLEVHLSSNVNPSITTAECAPTLTEFHESKEGSSSG